MNDSTEPLRQHREPDTTAAPEKKFHGWRLVGVIFCVVVVIAAVSAIVDWIVIGPLEGRVF